MRNKYRGHFKDNPRYLPALIKIWAEKAKKRASETKWVGCLWCGGGGHTGVTLVTVYRAREKQEPEKLYACARCLVEKTRKPCAPSK